MVSGAATRLNVEDAHNEAHALARVVRAALKDKIRSDAARAHGSAAAVRSRAEALLTARCRAGALIALHAKALTGDLSIIEVELDADLVKANVRTKLGFQDLHTACAIYREVDRWATALLLCVCICICFPAAAAPPQTVMHTVQVSIGVCDRG